MCDVIFINFNCRYYIKFEGVEQRKCASFTFRIVSRCCYATIYLLIIVVKSLQYAPDANSRVNVSEKLTVTRTICADLS